MRRRTDAALRGIVRARRPIGSAPNAGLHDRRVLADERREDAAVVDELEALGRDLDMLRHDGVAARERLRRGRRLQRLLRHGPLVDADDRLTRLAVEDVRPARLADLDDRFARAPADVQIHEHDGIARVVVPDVVMHLLEVPTVFPGRELDRDDRHRIEVVAGAHGAVVVGARVARREVDEAELRDRWPAFATRLRRRISTNRCLAARCRAPARRGPESCRTSRRIGRRRRRTL